MNTKYTMKQSNSTVVHFGIIFMDSQQEQSGMTRLSLIIPAS